MSELASEPVSMSWLDPGVWAVVATPFDDDLRVDVRSLERLVSFYTDLGVTGLTVLGVFGEAAALSRAERDLVLRTVSGATDLPLVVGLTSLTTAPAVEEATATLAAAARVRGLMVQVNSPRAGVCASHLEAIVAATDTPVVVQDYPLASGVTIATGELAQVISGVGSVAAVKAEAPPTPPAIAELSPLGPPVFGGLGGIGLLDELAAGSAGAMTGFSYPEGLLACVAAHRSGGYVAAREAYLPYLPLVNFEQQAKIALAVRKECLRVRGLFATGRVRPPAGSLPAALRPQLERHLAATAAAATGS